VYLVDRVTGRVYTAGATHEWPRPVGHLIDGDAIHLIARKGDLLKSADTFLGTQRARLRQLFDRLDVTQSGAITSAQLSKLAELMVPQVSAVDGVFFQVVIDADASGKLTFEELTSSIVDSFKLSQQAQQHASATVADTLAPVAESLRSSPTSLRRLQEVLGLGLGIPLKEAMTAVRAAAPGLPKAAWRALTVALSHADLNNSGRVSFLDLQFCLRLCTVVRSSWKGPPLRLDGTVPPAPAPALSKVRTHTAHTHALSLSVSLSLFLSPPTHTQDLSLPLSHSLTRPAFCPRLASLPS
jgi:hypothetical protein